MSTYPPPTSDTPIFDPARFLTIDEALIEELREVLPNLSAVAPNNNNPFIFAINNTLVVKNDDTAPTASITLDADNSGTDFGLYFVGGGKPFNFETLDAEALQIKDTTLSLYDSTGTPNTTNLTADSVEIVGGGTATWAAIIAGGGGVPSISQVLTVGQSASNQPIIDLNGIAITGGTSLYANALSFTGASGAITDVSTINGSPYPPTYSTPNLNSVLSAGNNTSGFSIDFNNNSNIDNVVNINGSAYPPYPTAPYGLLGVLSISNDAVGASMTGINNIDLININGSLYPPTPPSTPDLSTVLNQGTSTGSNGINMNSNNIGSCNNIDVVSINNIPFLPAKFSNVFPTFTITSVGSGTTNVYGGSSSITIPVGNYQITYSVQFDATVLQSGGQYYSVKAYCWLQGASVGQVYPYKVNQGYTAGTLMSYNSSYPTCITSTDYIQISTADSFQLGVYQENELGQNANVVYISAIIQAV